MLLPKMPCGLLAVAIACATQLVYGEPAQTPLTNFPYTPSLDVHSMDRSVNPCEDFYQYACGGWQKNNPIPADKSRWDVYGKLYEDDQRFLWGILDGLAKQTAGRNANQQKIGDFFASCMDEAAIDKLGMTPIQPLLSQINALEDRRDLLALIAQLQLHAPGSFYFEFDSGQDSMDSDQVIPVVTPGRLGLPERDYYLKTDPKSKTLRDQYQAYVGQMLRLAGVGVDQADQQAARIVAMETDLARAMLTRTERRDPHKVYHRLDAKAMQGLLAEFDWTKYLQALGRPQYARADVTQPAYIRALVSEWHGESLDDIKLFLRWQLLNASAPMLSKDFVAAHFGFYGKTLAGTPQLAPRWERCVARTDALLGDALGQEFVKRVFTPQMKTDTQRLTKQIEDAMAQEIKGLKWMSEATKARALQKLHAVRNKIGYPDRWRDYASVDIKRNDYFGDAMRAGLFETNRQLDKIGKPVDRDEWGMTPPTVNAYYDDQMNDINFPAGILQPPLYDPKSDDAPNYGDTGGTIGHELTHAFDDSGRQYDAKGNLKNWWSRKDAKEFKRRAQCVIDEYGKFDVVGNIHINSVVTQGEDIADLGGLVLAWIAWKTETQDKHLAPIDGLSPGQRFFVGYAQWACSNIRPEAARLNALTDVHSPAKYRVNGLVVNMPQFQQAFSCHQGQPMVSERRCKIW